MKSKLILDPFTGRKIGPMGRALAAIRNRLPVSRARVAELLASDITMNDGALRARMGEMDRTEGMSSLRRRGRWDGLAELRRKYKGESEWGNQHCGVITDFNASMQWGNGLRILSNDPENKDPDELKVMQEFFDYNDLHEEQGIMLGVSGELDGQALLRWSVDRKAKQVRLWTVPLLETRYVVEYSDPWTPSGAVLYPGAPGEKRLSPDEFVFVKVRSLQNGTYGIPTSLRVLSEIEDLDKARTDLRKINNLFAKPTPVLTAKDEQSRKRMASDLGGVNAPNWKIGMALLLVEGDSFALHEMSPSALESLLSEITLLVKIISGATTVPVHFLGFPDLMSNRSVADADFEPCIIQAMKAQRVWAGGLEEIIPYVLDLYGKMHGREYDPEILTVTFPAPRQGDMEKLVTAWLPVRLAKQITAQTFLAKIGIEDPDGEIERLAQEAGAAMGGSAPPDEQQARIDALVAMAKDRQTAGLTSKDTPLLKVAKGEAA